MARRALQPTAARPSGHTRGDSYVRTPQRHRFIDYPRAGRTRWTRWLPSWKLVAAVMGFGFVLMVVAFVAAYRSTTLPTADSLISAQTTTIYFSDNKTVIGRLAVQNRQKVPYSVIPSNVRNSVLAAEDRTFFTNSGVSLPSIVRAAWSNARGNRLQGGSTITQQYVKNVFDLRDRSLKRKVKEFFIALKISKSEKKEDILGTYMNTIYLGRGSYGLQAAAYSYFNKPVTALSDSEAAYLAGIINGPELYDPADGAQSTARAKARWNYVLDGMVTMGVMPPQKRAALVFPKVLPPRQQNSFAGYKGYLITMARAEAARDLGISEKDVERGGYRIITTFNPKMMKEAQKAVHDELPKKQPKGLRVGMATIDPATGAVRSIYAGDDFIARPGQNAATQDTAQAGSTFKPFALLAALESGVTLSDRFDGSSPLRLKGEKKAIANFGGDSYGTIDLLTATAKSVNTAYVRLNEQIGPEKTKEAALRAGIPASAGVADNVANVLGSANPHPIDMASAYATIAAGGVRRAPYVVQTIAISETRKVAFQAHPEAKRVFDQEVITDATYAMQQVVKRGSGTYAQKLDREVAGKTGTSSDSLSAWFVGFTPQLTTAVAMYQLDAKGIPVPMKNIGGVHTIVGGGYPCRIWTEFMKDALEGTDKVDFPEPSNLQEIQPVPQPTGDGGGTPTVPVPTVSPTATVPETSKPTKTRHPRTTTLPFPTPTQH